MAGELGSDEKEKFLYLTQIKYLDEQLERCQLKCEKLEKQNKDLVCLYGALEKDKNDITEYLKHSVAAKEKEVDELVVQLEQQQRATEQDREALKLQHSQQEQQLQEQIDKRNLGNMRQALVLEEQEEQKKQLMELMQQRPTVESLEKQLVCEKEKYKAAIHSLQMEAVLEALKLTEQRQNTVDSCIKTEISKIEQEERAQHSEQLENLLVLLKENMILWEQKDDLQNRKENLCFEVDQLRENLNKLNQEVSSSKKKLEQLKMQLQQMEEEAKDCSLSNECLQEEEKTIRLLLASVSDECYQKKAEAAQLRAELQKESSRRRQLEGDVQEVAIILRRILTDSKKLSEKQTQRLLEILHSSTPQGIDSATQETAPTLSDAIEESSEGQKPQTSVPKPARMETQNLATDPLFLMARYRKGDLGLVPRPTWKHKPAPSSTQLPLNRKICIQKMPNSV